MYVRACLNAYVHTYVRTCALRTLRTVRMYVRTHVRTCAPHVRTHRTYVTCVSTYIFTYVCTVPRVCTHVRNLRTFVRTYIRMDVRACLRDVCVDVRAHVDALRTCTSYAHTYRTHIMYAPQAAKLTFKSRQHPKVCHPRQP